MSRQQKLSLAAGFLAVAGAAISALAGLEWLLVVSSVLMAVSCISTFYLAAQAKRYGCKRIFSARR